MHAGDYYKPYTEKHDRIRWFANWLAPWFIFYFASSQSVRNYLSLN